MPKGCFVYVLGSQDGGSQDKGAFRTYVGWTTDLDQRLEAHNSGKGAKSTRGRKWELLYAERYLVRGDAMSREWHIKKDRALRKQIAQGWT